MPELYCSDMFDDWCLLQILLEQSEGAKSSAGWGLQAGKCHSAGPAPEGSSPGGNTQRPPSQTSRGPPWQPGWEICQSGQTEIQVQPEHDEVAEKSWLGKIKICKSQSQPQWGPGRVSKISNGMKQKAVSRKSV